MFVLSKLTKQCLNQRLAHSKKVKITGISYIKDSFPPENIELLPKSKYGGVDSVTLLTGSTLLGKQGAKYIRMLFETAKVPVLFERITLDPNDKKVDPDFLVSVMRNRSAIYVDCQHDPQEKSKQLKLNNDLDLYACITKMHSFPGFKCRFPDVDITFITQNNTGDYSKLEYEPVSGIVETLRLCEEKTIRRFMQFVFKYAETHKRCKITFAQKRKVLPLSDGLFIQIAHDVGKQYPSIQIEEMDVGDLALQLIMRPKCFDMVCNSDRYGTSLISICSAVCGGASLFGTCELGDNHAVFKPLQTKLSLSECNVLSPYGIVRACIDLLIHLGNNDCGHVLFKELMHTMLVDGVKTAEFGGTDGGDFVICSIVNRLRCCFSS